VKDPLFESRFSVTLLNSLADLEIDFDREKPEHANAPDVFGVSMERITSLHIIDL